jgi:hypothetical protein
MLESLRELSNRRCDRLGSRELGPGAERSVAPGRAVALLATALLGVAPALSAREKKVQVRVQAPWEELAPFVERRDIETVLTNGVYLRGRAEQVLPDALEVQVKKTSDVALVPRGRGRIPRELVTVLTVKWKTRRARAVLTPVMAVALPYAVFVTLVFGMGVDTDDLGGAVTSIPLLIGSATVGYLLGDRIDTKWMRVIVDPKPPPQAPAGGEQAGEGIELEGEALWVK